MTYEPEDLPASDDAIVIARERARRERDAGEWNDENGRTITRERRDRERDICAKRLEHGGFCILPSQHSTVSNGSQPCRGLPAQYGPALPSPDRKLMSAFRSELSEKYDTKVDKNGISPAMRWVARAEGRKL